MYLSVDLAANIATALNAHGFANIQANMYWTSSSYAPFTGSAWFVYFDFGRVGSLGKADDGSSRAWCVRGDTSASPAPLWQTGQTKCYDSASPANEIPCAGTGQDGELQAGVEWDIETRFTDNGNNTVTDTLTGLVWQQDPSLNNSGNALNWQTALDTCNNLNQGGQTDWHLANRTELYSLVDWAEIPATALNANGFANVQTSSYWTSSSSAQFSENSSWVVAFSLGSVSEGNKTSVRSVRAWYVRGGL